MPVVTPHVARGRRLALGMFVTASVITLSALAITVLHVLVTQAS